jgi:hypothetical protein
LSGHGQLLGSHVQQNSARLRRRIAQRLGPRLNTQCTRCTALVERGGGIAHMDGDLLKGHVQLLGHDLADGDFQALAKIDLAVEGGDFAVRCNGNPGVQLLGGQRWFGGGA